MLENRREILWNRNKFVRMLEKFFTLIYIYLFVISDFIVFEIYRIQYILIKK